MLAKELNVITLAAILADESDEKAREYVESLLWPDGPVCPHCSTIGEAFTMRIKRKQTPNQKLRGDDPTYRTVYKCKPCRQPFTVRIGTIFEDSHIDLRYWIGAFQLMCSSKKGMSSLQIQRTLGIKSYKTAWFMTHRIREAMTDYSECDLTGTVEVDETYVGGKPRPGGPKSKRGRGTDKAPVLALVERDGSVRAFPVQSITANELKGAILDTVDVNSKIVTDGLPTYKGIGQYYTGGHSVVSHSTGEYKNEEGEFTNTAESFFSLIKRGHIGAFHKMSKQHLHRYVNEFAFRWNHRKTSDGERMETAIEGVKGKRLYYNQPESPSQGLLS